MIIPATLCPSTVWVLVTLNTEDRGLDAFGGNSVYTTKEAALASFERGQREFLTEMAEDDDDLNEYMARLHHMIAGLRDYGFCQFSDTWTQLEEVPLNQESVA